MQEAIIAQPVAQAGVADDTLMAQICEGGGEALATLFRRYARLVRTVSFRVLRDVSEAEDLVQDVFLLVHRDCKAFDRSKAPARFWILQIAYRRAISRRRYLTSRDFYTRVELDEAAGQLTDPQANTARLEEIIDGRLENRRIQKAFAELSENQRQTIRMFFFEGYTINEIAAKLGQSRGNVKNHYFRGLERLRKELFGSKLPRQRSV